MRQEFKDAEFISSRDFAGGVPAWVGANQAVTVRSVKLDPTLLNRRLYAYIWAGSNGNAVGLLNMRVRLSLKGEDALILPLLYVVRQDLIASSAVNGSGIIPGFKSMLTFPNPQNNVDTTQAPDAPVPTGPAPGCMQLVLQHNLRDNFQAELAFNNLFPLPCDFSADLLEIQYVSAGATVNTSQIRAYAASIAWNKQ